MGVSGWGSGVTPTTSGPQELHLGGPVAPFHVPSWSNLGLPRCPSGVLLIGIFCDFGWPTMGKVRPTMGQTRKGTQGKLSATGAQHWPLGGLCGSEESPNGALLSDETAELVVPSGTGDQ